MRKKINLQLKIWVKENKINRIEIKILLIYNYNYNNSLIIQNVNIKKSCFSK